MLYSYGYGDGGGGPTEEMLIRAEAINYLPILPKVNLKEIPKYEPKEIWKGEIYLGNIFRSTYSVSKSKRSCSDFRREVLYCKQVRIRKYECTQ